MIGKNRRACAFFIFSFLWFGVSHRADAQIVESVSVAVALEGLRSTGSELLAEAEQAMQYSTWNALRSALDAIDAFEAANKEILGKAVKDIDRVLRDQLQRLDSSLQTLSRNILGASENVLTASENMLQLSQSTLAGRGEIYLLRTVPRFLCRGPGEAGQQITVRGVNLDKGKLQLANSSPGKLRLLGPLEATIDVSIPPKTDSPTSRLTFHLLHDDRVLNWFEDIFVDPDRVSRTLSVPVYPEKLARVRAKGRKTLQVKTTDTYRCDGGNFRGRNRDVEKGCSPRTGWQWDTSDHSKFEVIQGGGHAARCRGINWNASSPNGVTIRARCDTRQDRTCPFGCPGNVGCDVKGPVFQIVSQTSQWATEWMDLLTHRPTELVLPEGTSEYTVELEYYDGRMEILTGVASSVRASLERSGSNLIVRSKVDCTPEK